MSNNSLQFILGGFMESRRTKLANLRANYFIRPQSTLFRCGDRVFIQDKVVGTRIGPHPPRGRLGSDLAFFRWSIREAGGSPRLSNVPAWLKQGAWRAGVVGTWQYFDLQKLFWFVRRIVSLQT